MMNKKELMQELLNRYEQLENMKGCKSAMMIVEQYIMKLEIKLRELLNE